MFSFFFSFPRHQQNHHNFRHNYWNISIGKIKHQTGEKKKKNNNNESFSYVHVNSHHHL